MRHVTFADNVSKVESQEAGGETEKDENKRVKSLADPGEAGAKTGDQERRISLYIPSPELTLSAQKSTDQ